MGLSVAHGKTIMGLVLKVVIGTENAMAYGWLTN
jgi:hypothetical protein